MRIYDEALNSDKIVSMMQLKHVIVTPTKLNIDEGKSGSYEISLQEDPGEEVEISITPADNNLALTSGQNSGAFAQEIVIAFNSGNWQNPQTVFVLSADDDITGDLVVKIVHTVANPAYDLIIPVTVNISDNEPTCGAWGYSLLDVNKDCYVNLKDFVMLASNWLVCTDPENANCISMNDFTIIALPDTQVYSESYPHHFIAQTQWIKDNVDDLNIKYVLHLGDITDDNNTAQWNNAKAALSILDGVVPYALAPGNHDYGSNGSANSRDTFFLNASDNLFPYFGTGTPYASQSNIGGFYTETDGTVRTDNSWHTFEGAGKDFLVIALEFGPRDPVVDWAKTIVEAHPNHYAILITHAYMYSDETRYDWAAKSTSQSWNPHAYSVAALPGGVNDGQELWQKMVKRYHNFIMTINGHVLNDGAARLTSIGDNGNDVHQILANYQHGPEGGQEYLRIFKFKIDKNIIEVKTYSPVLDNYKTDSQNEFTLQLPW